MLTDGGGVTIEIAFDRASVRSVDKDGHLHVASSNITKACINPYYGREIPDWERLGLEPDRVYKLLRDPKELERAAPTFAGKPLLDAHKPTTAEDHQSDDVVGSVMNPRYVHPYLKAELVVWPGRAIEAIENGSLRALSAGYRYTPDMTPGVYDGERYDGVMRNIFCNHVALVHEGRAGGDVVVADSADEVLWNALESALRMAFDADRWITVHPNGPGSTGTPALIGEGGEIKAGMGGKFNGKHISEAHGVKGRANSRTSAYAAFGGQSQSAQAKSSVPAAPATTAPSVSPATTETGTTAMPAIAEGHSRLHDPIKIKKTTERAYGVVDTNDPGPDPKRPNLIWYPKSHVSVEGKKIVGVAPWLAQKNGLAAEPDKSVEAKKRDDEWEVSRPDYKPKLQEGHFRLDSPRKIQKETANGIAIPNRYSAGPHDEYRWLPKSAVSVEHGHVVGVAPWLQEKHGLALHEESKPQAAAAKKRTYLNVPYAEKDAAKEAGARWDSMARRWYHEGGDVPESLSKWNGSASQTTQAAASTPSIPASRKPPEKGRIDDGAPSVWGSELLGWEGERWEAFHRSPEGQRLKRKYEQATDEAGDFGGPIYAEDGHDDPLNYDWLGEDAQ